MNEFVPGYEVLGWLGFGVTAGTPADIIDKLNREISAGIAEDTLKKAPRGPRQCADENDPAEYRKLIADENDKWAKVIKFAGIKLG